MTVDGPDSLEELGRLPEGEIDVVRGAMLIARDAYSSLDVGAIVHQLDELVEPLAARDFEALRATEQAPLLANHIYGTLGFSPNETAYYDPKNSLLPDVLGRRTGIPLTLAIIYCEIARRVGVQARGVGFPGHFLVRVDRNARAMESPGAILVDPYGRGRVLDPEGVMALLRRAAGPGEPLRPEYLLPSSPRAILVRMLVNLKTVYLSRGDFARAHLALDRIVTLTPASTLAVRERGRIAAKLGALEAARTDLERALELTQNPREAASIRAELESLGPLRPYLH